MKFLLVKPVETANISRTGIPITGGCRPGIRSRPRANGITRSTYVTGDLVSDGSDWSMLKTLQRMYSCKIGRHVPKTAARASL